MFCTEGKMWVAPLFRCNVYSCKRYTVMRSGLMSNHLDIVEDEVKPKGSCGTQCYSCWSNKGQRYENVACYMLFELQQESKRISHYMPRFCFVSLTTSTYWWICYYIPYVSTYFMLYNTLFT